MLKFLSIFTKRKPKKGVYVVAQKNIVTIVHSGTPCPMTPQLAREVSKQLIRFADIAEGSFIHDDLKETANAKLQPNVTG